MVYRDPAHPAADPLKAFQCFLQAAKLGNRKGYYHLFAAYAAGRAPPRPDQGQGDAAGLGAHGLPRLSARPPSSASSLRFNRSAWTLLRQVQSLKVMSWHVLALDGRPSQ
ncbi:hypothetical protein L0F63_004796, partial [Massospora cicadina]